MGSNFTEPIYGGAGVYYAVLPNSSGCDSIKCINSQPFLKRYYYCNRLHIVMPNHFHGIIEITKSFDGNNVNNGNIEVGFACLENNGGPVVGANNYSPNFPSDYLTNHLAND